MSDDEQQQVHGNRLNNPAHILRLSAGLGTEEDNKKKKSKRKSQEKTGKKEREKFKNGHIFFSEQHKYKVIELLGSGGFGDVYKVQELQSLECYAAKTEQCNDPTIDKRLMRLKMEMRILENCHKVPSNRRKHFVAYHDRGRTNTVKFVVMGLVGPSLDDIRKEILQKDFSRPTVMQLAAQTLQSIWDLHEVGWLHRDIKPQNFAVGLGENQQIVYMLDFGIARKFKDSKGGLKIPRERVKFIGTVRFASRNCHKQAEQCRMDDLEVWMYMTVDLFDSHALPWRRQCDKQKVLKMKDCFFDLQYPKEWRIDVLDIFRVVPIDFKRLIRYIDGLYFIDEPDYEYVIDCLKRIADIAKIDMTQKLDWIGNSKTKGKKKGDEVDSDMEKEASAEEESEESDEKKAAKKKAGKTKKMKGGIRKSRSKGRSV